MTIDAGARRRSWWGWGYEDAQVTADQVDAIGAALTERIPGHPVERRGAPELSQVSMPPPRVEPPAALASICASDVFDRALHTYGRSFRDIVRGFHAELPHPPDLVAHPRDEADVVDLLEWCTDEGIAAVPFGGGSSVVGGADGGGPWAERFAGVVSIDLTRLDRVLEIDRASRAVRVQAGALGPVLEDQLRPHGLTLRHFPQSFEVSTVGGWLATRSGGHFATGPTHIDELVESIRTVTPAGIVESRRLPASGAGPSPDRMVLGSEGTLGVITEAWLRVQERPRWKASASVRFRRFLDGAAAVRALAQSGLQPAGCRLLDSGEAATSAGADDGASVLVLAFESADHPVDAAAARALELCADHGGTCDDGIRSSTSEGASGAWRSSFIAAPYLRDAVVALGWIAETFETAVTWDRFEAFHAAVTDAVEGALREVCGGGTVTCRTTHAYADGVAPYFTILAPSRHGSQVAMWDEVKVAASEALISCGGTITHHHAVGRDHRRWYDRQRPDLFAAALGATKDVLDPGGVLNPGVLVDPRR